MRKKLLGTMAALAAGAGGALAQPPARTTAPAPLAAVGAFDGGMKDPSVRQANGYDPVPPPGMGGPGEMPGGPGMGIDPMMGGGPGYPPQGVYGGAAWQEPKMDGILGGGAGGAPRLYVDGQYLLVFPKSQPTGYPLLTTGAPAAGEQGRVGASTTTILSGNADLGLGTASGFRVNGGFWRPQDQRLGVEVGGLYLSPTTNTTYLKSSDGGIPLIARPFNSTATGANGVLIVSSPGVVNGEAVSRASTTFWGIEANAMLNLFRSCPDDCRSWSLNLLGGYRFMELEEVIAVTSRSTALPGRTLPYAGTIVGPGTTVEVRDRFDVLTKFHGAQVGLQSQFNSGRWYVGVTGKVAFGVSNQKVTIDGSTAAVNPVAGTSSSSLGGLFANASNIGIYRTDQFAILTDLNGSLGYNFTSWLTGTVGYNFVHLSSVARPGFLYNGRVDPSLVPTSGTYGTGASGSPAVNLKQTDFFVHGLNFGFIIKY